MHSMQEHQRRLPTSYNECSTLPCSVPERVSYRWASWCTAVFTARPGTSVPRRPSHYILRRRFSASSAFCKPTPAHRTSLSTQPCTSRETLDVHDSTHMAVGRFRLLVRRSGIRCLASSEIRRVVPTVLSSFLRQSCLVFTNVTSALEVFTSALA